MNPQVPDQDLGGGTWALLSISVGFFYFEVDTLAGSSQSSLLLPPPTKKEKKKEVQRW